MIYQISFWLLLTGGALGLKIFCSEVTPLFRSPESRDAFSPVSNCPVFFGTGVHNKRSLNWDEGCTTDRRQYLSPSTNDTA